MSEVRPWVGASISLAQFEVARPLNIVDCSRLHGRYAELAYLNRTFNVVDGTLSAPTPEEFEQIVWAAIDNAFSAPVTEGDELAAYAPTQVIAELFRSEAYDGIAYKSAFGERGFSVVLFNLNSAKQVNGMLHEVKSIAFTFTEHPQDQYFVRDDETVVRNVIVSVEPLPKKDAAEG